LLLVRVKSRFRAFEKVVRHGVECVSLAWISAPFEALVIFDAQEHEATLFRWVIVTGWRNASARMSPI